MAKIDDNLAVTINIRWLVQIIFLVGAMCAGYFTLKMDVNKALSDAHELDKRLSVIEDARSQQLEQVNKSLMDRVFKKSSNE